MAKITSKIRPLAKIAPAKSSPARLLKANAAASKITDEEKPLTLQEGIRIRKAVGRKF